MEDLWTDPEIKKTISLLDPMIRYEYSKIGKRLFTNRNDYDCLLFESASQIRLMLRDGLDEKSLTDDEKYVLISVYGADFVENTLNVSLPYENE